ncbi:FAD-dependent oxidoreductase [Amycolatopsis suaedae]|uniref:FAD-dependent oxidoreductase n=1 Tax=Amycolatopsis suaedae TaxID=2510978 RepID=A0A4Q7J152_9PSEU|nr:FAD-dependent oxidoreductase [Amycolatopsis suaedae]RZQ59664.1 FAD-dependent oxidoreductase [Amycolatopsis suaedae]
MSYRVVVVGGGYGGAAVAKALDADTDVVLVEPKDAFVHAAGSLRALVRPDWAGNIFFPYDRLLTRGEVVHAYATAAGPGEVTLSTGGRLTADAVVLATGSGYPFPAKTDTDVTSEALDRIRATHAELAGARRVLITGAGPVGLELAGEITAGWPDKEVTIVDPATELLPGYLPRLRAELHRQLDALGVRLLLGTTLTEPPPADPGQAKTFTAGTTGGEVTADIWFRCHGVRVATGYLDRGLLTARGQVRVTGSLTVAGHDGLHAVGDLTDVAEPKMAANAMRHAEVVAGNIAARARGDRPTAVYRPSAEPAILLPLGPHGGVGQVPGEDGSDLLPAATVAEYKGRDLLTGRFAELFGTG